MSLLKKAVSATGSLVRVLIGAGAAALVILRLKEKAVRGPRRKPGITS